MKKIALATLLLLISILAAEARGGQQTWILVCPKSLPKSDCNLTTAAKWYHLPAPQASASTPAIKAARAKVVGAVEDGYYVSQEQIPRRRLDGGTWRCLQGLQRRGGAR